MHGSPYFLRLNYVLMESACTTKKQGKFLYRSEEMDIKNVVLSLRDRRVG